MSKNKSEVTSEQIYSILSMKFPEEFPSLYRMRKVYDQRNEPAQPRFSNPRESIKVDTEAAAWALLKELAKQEITEFHVSFSPAREAGMVLDSNWESDEDGDSIEVEREVFQTALPDTFYVNFQMHNLTYAKEKTAYDREMIGYSQHIESRREAIRLNQETKKKNDDLLTSARKRSLDLWRYIAKALATGETMDNVRMIELLNAS